MKLVLRKLDVEGIEQLESLVTEHIDSIEPGLRVVDSRLFLGHATIDVVALDASGSLVLVALGFQADEHLLLQVVEAYSWCLEYPDTVRRHYPSVRVSEERPPRVMFVIDRISDAFTRKIKQLNFAAVDCVEYRHIDVNGIPAMYFETVARVRRGAVVSATHDVVAAPPQIIKAAAPRESRVVPLASHAAEPARVRMIEIPTEPAKAEALGELIAASAAARHANGIAGGSDHVAVIAPAPAAAPAPVIERPVAAPVVAAPVIERPVAAPVVAAPAPVVAAPAPVVAAPAPVVAVPAPVVAAPAPVAAAPAPVVAAPASVVTAPAPVVEAPIVVAAPAPAVEPPVAVAPVRVPQPEVVAVAPAPVEEPEIVAAVAPAPIAEPEVVVEAPAAPVAAAPEPQKEETGERGRISFAQAVKGQEIGGLQFPKDGALTRQWIEFLNQLSAK